MKSAEKEIEKKSTKIMNAVKRSAIAEHLVNNQSCIENLNLERFKILKSCCIISNLVKMEAICILNRKTGNFLG